MSNFEYESIFQYGKDATEFKKLEIEGISAETFQGKEMLMVNPSVLTELTSVAFRDINHLL